MPFTQILSVADTAPRKSGARSGRFRRHSAIAFAMPILHSACGTRRRPDAPSAGAPAKRCACTSALGVVATTDWPQSLRWHGIRNFRRETFEPAGEPIAQGRRWRRFLCRPGKDGDTGRRRAQRPELGRAAGQYRIARGCKLLGEGADLPHARWGHHDEGRPAMDPSAVRRQASAGGRFPSHSRVAEFGEADRRTLADFRRSSAVEAIAGDATPAALAHAMGNTLKSSNALFATYVPVNVSSLRAVAEARRRGRTSLGERSRRRSWKALVMKVELGDIARMEGDKKLEG
jgi:hypothetical protein